MAVKLIKVKNISRNMFTLNLSFVTPKKVLRLNPDVVVDITLEEYTYLTTQCPGAFEKGKLEIVNVDEELDIIPIKSENVMSNEDIESLLGVTLPKFKTKIAEITASALLADIRIAAVEANKSDKYLDVIDAKITEINDGSLLI